ncbi:uncharacterized protein BX663DRAFT_518293 [Cokeromyces recurvatus]|uniref:uncharacterized protein n=1 Tax=Cokeromyces recurvatus TaxID=90255 RepID=UPI0022206ACF|nr:uncharacterized protein BX663DRAFT_518293 [Cokeromyces recurvatus]KAI7900331.1 hypothetical protein BX663DRAFT_518293 [Cokeromyces recurvatus]
MFNTIYKLRLFIEETSQYYPILLCAIKDKEPTFNDLMKYIQRTISMNVNLNNCHFATVDTNIILSDDYSFKNALKCSILNRKRLEIVLYNNNSKKISLSSTLVTSTHHTHSEIKVDNAPVIKPTAYKWMPDSLSLNTIVNTDSLHQMSYVRRSHNKQNFYHENLDGPLRKKQRVLLNHPHSRKLPEPYSIASKSLLSFRNNNNIILDHNNNSPHPLEIRPKGQSIATDSTTLPYISSAFSSSPTPTLPAISSLTVRNEDFFLGFQQLAPIIHHEEEEEGMKGKLNKKRIRASVASTNHTHNVQQTAIYQCDHIAESGKVCGQTFRRSYDLSRHQTIHLKNRPFCYCDKCGKKFTRMDALRRHERVQGHYSSSAQHQKQHRSLSTSALPPQKMTHV